MMCVTEIVEGVRNGSKCLRPTTELPCEEEVTSLMKRCWAEDPADRPDFTTLKATIRRLNKWVTLTYPSQYDLNNTVLGTVLKWYIGRITGTVGGTTIKSRMIRRYIEIHENLQRIFSVLLDQYIFLLGGLCVKTDRLWVSSNTQISESNSWKILLAVKLFCLIFYVGLYCDFDWVEFLTINRAWKWGIPV